VALSWKKKDISEVVDSGGNQNQAKGGESLASQVDDSWHASLLACRGGELGCYRSAAHNIFEIQFPPQQEITQ
jgi:hypothetical protein